MTGNNFTVIQDLCINDVTVSSSAYSKSGYLLMSWPSNLCVIIYDYYKTTCYREEEIVYVFLNE